MWSVKHSASLCHAVEDTVQCCWNCKNGREISTPHFSVIRHLRSLTEDLLCSLWSIERTFCYNFCSQIWKQVAVLSARVWFPFCLLYLRLHLYKVKYLVHFRLNWYGIFLHIIDRHGYCQDWLNSNGKWYWWNSNRSFHSFSQLTRISSVSREVKRGAMHALYQRSFIISRISIEDISLLI